MKKISDKNYIVRFEFRPDMMIAIPYIIVDEEPEEMTFKYSDFEECHSGNAPIWSPLVWQLRNDYGLYR